MQDRSSEQDRKPSAGPAGEDRSRSVTTQLRRETRQAGWPRSQRVAGARLARRLRQSGAAAERGLRGGRAPARNPAEDGPAGRGASVRAAGHGARRGRDRGGRRPSRRSPRLAACPARRSAVFGDPQPAPENKVFVEDDDGTGADSQANILQLGGAGPGARRVAPRGTPAGAGVILTPSGLVLTSDQVLQGARRRDAYASCCPGGRSPPGLVGADATHGLALLQIEGGPAFRPSRWETPGT